MTYNKDIKKKLRFQAEMIKKDYEILSPERVKSDAGTAGDQTEEKWKEILESWLPSDYTVVTKGKIINESGKESPQLDIIVLKPFYPEGLKGWKYYLFDGVAAAFECKRTLHKKDIIKSCETAKKLIDLDTKTRFETILGSLQGSIIYGVLSDTHEWKKKNSKPIKNLEKTLREQHKNTRSPKDYIDFILINDLNLWYSYKKPAISTLEDLGMQGKNKHISEPITCFGKAKIEEFGDPLANMVYVLYQLLSLRDKRLNRFKKYIRTTVCKGFTGITEFKRWKNYYTETQITEFNSSTYGEIFNISPFSS